MVQLSLLSIPPRWTDHPEVPMYTISRMLLAHWRTSWVQILAWPGPMPGGRTHVET